METHADDSEADIPPPPPGTEPALPLPSISKLSEHDDDEESELPIDEKDDYDQHYSDERHSQVCINK